MLAARGAGIDAIAVLSGGFARDDLESCDPITIYEGVWELERDYEKSPLAREPAVNGE